MGDRNRSSWSSRTGFLLAAIGSAIGLGNIWRFPYIAYKNGGGAFLIPYAVALFFVGVPLLIAEQGVGSYFKASAPLAFSRIGKRWEWVGWFPVMVVMFGIMLYYTVVLGWCINYLTYSFGLTWGSNTENFFHTCFLNLTSGPFDLGGICVSVLIGTFVVWALIWYISIRGINRGLELTNKICIPLLGIMMLVMLVWVVFIDGSGEGMIALLTPDISKLSEPSVWADAFSQVFFSLSVAIGIMFAYSSYLKPNAPIVNNSWIMALADSGFAIFAGLVVFATLGTMAHKSGVPLENVVKGGPGLAFVVYPKAISMLPFGSHLFGMLFFLSLLFAGITSAISILEAFVCAVIDKFGTSRKKAVTIACILGVLGSTIFTTGGGLFWLDIVDYFVMNFGVLSIGLLEALVIGWVYKASKVSEYVNASSSWKAGNWWIFSIKYCTPAILLVLLVGTIMDNVEKPYGGYPWDVVLLIGIGWLTALLIASIVFAKIRGVARQDPVNIEPGGATGH